MLLRKEMSFIAKIKYCSLLALFFALTSCKEETSEDIGLQKQSTDFWYTPGEEYEFTSVSKEDSKIITYRVTYDEYYNASVTREVKDNVDGINDCSSYIFTSPDNTTYDDVNMTIDLQETTNTPGQYYIIEFDPSTDGPAYQANDGDEGEGASVEYICTCSGEGACKAELNDDSEPVHVECVDDGCEGYCTGEVQGTFFSDDLDENILILQAESLEIEDYDSSPSWYEQGEDYNLTTQSLDNSSDLFKLNLEYNTDGVAYIERKIKSASESDQSAINFFLDHETSDFNFDDPNTIVTFEELNDGYNYYFVPMDKPLDMDDIVLLQMNDDSSITIVCPCEGTGSCDATNMSEQGTVSITCTGDDCSKDCSNMDPEVDDDETIGFPQVNNFTIIQAKDIEILN